MPKKIGGDNRVALAEPGNHVLPRRRVTCNSVKEDQQRATTGTSIAEPVTVEGDLNWFHQLTFPARGH